MFRFPFLALLFLGGCIACFNAPFSVSASPDGSTYYISPDGNNSNTGLTEEQAWATFDRAWAELYPGDTLILVDGIYTQTLRPSVRGGQAGNPITIRAQNDGKAIIDGEDRREPVVLQAYQNAEYFVFEGIVARNSNKSVYTIFAPNNTFRRVSGYNANVDHNEHIFSIWSDNVVLEDCVASGSGRKMIMAYKSNNTVIRRCYAHWTQWDGRDFCNPWPWGDGIQVYIGDDNIIENSIVNGPVPGFGLSIQANGEPNETNVVGNQILGSASLNAGMNEDGSVKDWGNTRPGPTTCDGVRDFGWPAQRTGFAIWGPGDTRDNLFQDILAWGNAGLGFAIEGIQIYENPTVNRATIVNNGLGLWDGHLEGPKGNNVRSLDRLDITNSEIGGTTFNGEGVRLMNRYVNGTLTNEALWPWPMEERIRDELGISVTNLMAGLLPEQIDPVDGPIPTRLPPTSTPTPLPTPTPAPIEGILIPGRIEMERYHDYFDQSPGNLFSSEAPSYSDDVDVRQTSDEGGGYKIGAIDPNEWLDYQVTVTEAGTYQLSARIASEDQAVSKQFQVFIDRGTTNEIGPLLVAPIYSSGWDTFIDVPAGLVELTAGPHTLRVLMETGWFDINYIDVARVQSGGGSPTPQSTPATSTSVSTTPSAPTGTSMPTANATSAQPTGQPTEGQPTAQPTIQTPPSPSASSEPTVAATAPVPQSTSTVIPDTVTPAPLPTNTFTAELPPAKTPLGNATQYRVYLPSTQ